MIEGTLLHSSCQTSESSQMTTHVLQLSDLHIFAEPGKVSMGVPTYKSLAEVLEKVIATGVKFDQVVISGDLAQDEQRESYLAIREMIGRWLNRCNVIPGNHDNRALLLEVFAEQTAGTNEGVRFSITAGGWRLIGIDTQMPGKITGRVAPAMLDWLADELQRNARKPTILFAHHPPIPVGSAWIDAIGLLDPEPLRKLIVNSPQVRVVSCGHVHQESCGTLGDTVVMTTPSTGVQFIPMTDTARVHAIAPGFRMFALEEPDGSEDNDADPSRCRWTSRVIRLAGITYPAVDA